MAWEISPSPSAVNGAMMSPWRARRGVRRTAPASRSCSRPSSVDVVGVAVSRPRRRTSGSSQPGAGRSPGPGVRRGGHRGDAAGSWRCRSAGVGLARRRGCRPVAGRRSPAALAGLGVDRVARGRPRSRRGGRRPGAPRRPSGRSRTSGGGVAGHRSRCAGRGGRARRTTLHLGLVPLRRQPRGCPRPVGFVVPATRRRTLRRPRQASSSPASSHPQHVAPSGRARLVGVLASYAALAGSVLALR